ncbi:transcription regulator [Mycoplasma sp. CAG:877]|jgi:comK protein|nr:transcription regulator [Mycoplasma sp. CAG:877]
MKYEISRGTLAIVPNSEENSLVYEDDSRYIVNETPFKIMEDSCKYFGSTYNGRKDSAKSILGAEYKVPIIVEENNNIIVFPTTSPSSADCVWISLGRIKYFEKIDSSNTKIVFDNNREIIVPCSYRTIENQVSRASRLDLVMRNRKNR